MAKEQGIVEKFQIDRVGVRTPGWITLHIEVPPTAYRIIKTPRGEARIVILQDRWGEFTVDGLPRLPYRPVVLAIPPNARVTGFEAIALQTRVLAGRYELPTVHLKPVTIGFDPDRVEAIRFRNRIDDANIAIPGVERVSVTEFFNKTRPLLAPEGYLPGFVTPLRYQVGYFRHYKLFRTFVLPFQYDPVERRILVYEKIELRIYYEPEGDLLPRIKEPNIFDAIALNIVDNPGSAREWAAKVTFPVRLQAGANDPTLYYFINSSGSYYDISTDQITRCDMLIICTNQLADAWSIYADSKFDTNRLPHGVGILTLEEVNSTYDGVDLPERIHYAIADMVNQLDVIYVILGFDASFPPGSGFEDETEAVNDSPLAGCRFITWYDYVDVDNDNYYEKIYSPIPSDQYFAGLDHDWNLNDNYQWGQSWGDFDDIGVANHGFEEVDWYADVFVGRVPTNTTTQVDNYRVRVEQFETNIGSDFYFFMVGGQLKSTLTGGIDGDYLTVHIHDEAGWTQDDTAHVRAYYVSARLGRKGGNVSQTFFIDCWTGAETWSDGSGHQPSVVVWNAHGSPGGAYESSSGSAFVTNSVLEGSVWSPTPPFVFAVSCLTGAFWMWDNNGITGEVQWGWGDEKSLAESHTVDAAANSPNSGVSRGGIGYVGWAIYTYGYVGEESNITDNGGTVTGLSNGLCCLFFKFAYRSGLTNMGVDFYMARTLYWLDIWGYSTIENYVAGDYWGLLYYWSWQDAFDSTDAEGLPPEKDAALLANLFGDPEIPLIRTAQRLWDVKPYLEVEIVGIAERQDTTVGVSAGTNTYVDVMPNSGVSGAPNFTIWVKVDVPDPALSVVGEAPRVWGARIGIDGYWFNATQYNATHWYLYVDFPIWPGIHLIDALFYATNPDGWVAAWGSDRMWAVQPYDLNWQEIFARYDDVFTNFTSGVLMWEDFSSRDSLDDWYFVDPDDVASSLEWDRNEGFYTPSGCMRISMSGSSTATDLAVVMHDEVLWWLHTDPFWESWLFQGSNKIVANWGIKMDDNTYITFFFARRIDERQGLFTEITYAFGNYLIGLSVTDWVDWGSGSSFVAEVTWAGPVVRFGFYAGARAAASVRIDDFRIYVQTEDTWAPFLDTCSQSTDALFTAGSGWSYVGPGAGYADEGYAWKGRGTSTDNLTSIVLDLNRTWEERTTYSGAWAVVLWFYKSSGGGTLRFWFYNETKRQTEGDPWDYHDYSIDDTGGDWRYTGIGLGPEEWCADNFQFKFEWQGSARNAEIYLDEIYFFLFEYDRSVWAFWTLGGWHTRHQPTGYASPQSAGWGGEENYTLYYGSEYIDYSTNMTPIWKGVAYVWLNLTWNTSDYDPAMGWHCEQPWLHFYVRWNMTPQSNLTIFLYRPSTDQYFVVYQKIAGDTVDQRHNPAWPGWDEEWINLTSFGLEPDIYILYLWFEPADTSGSGFYQNHIWIDSIGVCQYAATTIAPEVPLPLLLPIVGVAAIAAIYYWAEKRRREEKLET